LLSDMGVDEPDILGDADAGQRDHIAAELRAGQVQMGDEIKVKRADKAAVAKWKQAPVAPRSRAWQGAFWEWWMRNATPCHPSRALPW